ncbi:MAG: putative ABC transporter permease [Candidatus Coprovivens sp.]
MINTICFYFILFIIYSFIGWSIEVIGKLIEKHKFINRGFLIGPLCPIYGWGCLLLILLLSRYKNDPLVLFCMAIIICSVLEYFTSYIMEKLFHARWWDYTRRKYNINGRICAETMIPFGILGCLVIYIINPFIVNILDNISYLNYVAFGLFIIFLIDNIISFVIMFGFSKTMKTLEKDGTEEITKKVKELLLSRSVLYRRLVNAFPTLINAKDRLIMLQDNITKEINRINNEAINSIKNSIRKVSNKAKNKTKKD